MEHFEGIESYSVKHLPMPIRLAQARLIPQDREITDLTTGGASNTLAPDTFQMADAGRLIEGKDAETPTDSEGYSAWSQSCPKKQQPVLIG